MPKTNEQLIQDIIADSLTVGDLVDYLSKLPRDTLVGVVGHFGEFLPCDNQVDYSFLLRDTYVTPRDWDLSNKYRKNISVVGILVPDRGPAPD